MVGVADDPRWTTVFMISRGWGRRRGFTTKSDGMWDFSQQRHELVLDRRLKPPHQETHDDEAIDDVGGYPFSVMSDECFRGMVADA
jgi:hypothetical protein